MKEGFITFSIQDICYFANVWKVLAMYLRCTLLNKIKYGGAQVFRVGSPGFENIVAEFCTLAPTKTAPI